MVLAAGITGAVLTAVAATPVGTWITNTAVIEYGFSGTNVHDTVSSNAADTQVAGALSDSTGPQILTAIFNPTSAPNNGTLVRLSVTAEDTQSLVNTVLVHLALMGGADSTPLRDDGLGADTLAGDGIWNASFNVDTAIPSDTYDLPIFAVDSVGNTTRTSARLVVTDLSPSFARIVSLSDRAEIRVDGNAVSLFVGWSNSYSKVLFEYRSASSGNGAWTTCPVADWSDLNPDTQGNAWGVLWNMTGIPDDTYQVRARAWMTTGESDPSPAVVRLVKDSRDSWINEYNDTVAEMRVRRHRFEVDMEDTTIMSGGTSFTMPTSALDSPVVWIRMTEYRGWSGDAPPPQAGGALVVPGSGSYRKYEREDGVSAFGDWITISIPYPEGDLGVPADQLGIYRYDPALGTWVKEPGSWIDTERRLISVRVRHFTSFAVLAQASIVGLKGVLIYPNPFKPNDADPTNGSDYISGVANTGITFEQIPPGSLIRIYTTLGEQITERTVDATGVWQWNVRNDRGVTVASGVYLYYIAAPNGERMSGKLVIVR